MRLFIYHFGFSLLRNILFFFFFLFNCYAPEVAVWGSLRETTLRFLLSSSRLASSASILRRELLNMRHAAPEEMQFLSLSLSLLVLVGV